MAETIHEFVKMSSKGQIVLPQDIREELKAKEGSTFEVVLKDHLVVLKKTRTSISEKDLKLVKELEEAWKGVDRSKGKTPKEFFKEIKKW